MRVTRSQTRRLESIEQQKLEANKVEEPKQLQNKIQEKNRVKQPQKTKPEKIITLKRPNKQKVGTKSRKQSNKEKVVKAKRKGKKSEDEKQTAIEKPEEIIYGDNSLSSSNTESEHESESGSDDNDLDSLLNKAEAALTVSQHDTTISEKHDPIRKLSKMNHGINQSLYFKTTNGRSKLVEDAVQLIEDGQKSPRNALLVVKANSTLSKRRSRKERQEERAKSSGKEWFDMPKPEITPEVKRDLQILKMRHVLDRKRHYKKMGKQENPTYFQMGTIIEGPTEFFSARLTKKERKQTIVDELLASEEQKQYYKRKHDEVSAKANNGGKRDYKKLKAHRKSMY
ncbi:hypothetical protein G6F43_007460 [Rhizopus delemar]|nr:hypothetical protein G6F43_007460 [Rhizopus delemar]